MTLQFESVVLALLHIVGCVVKRVSLSTQVQPAGWTEVLVVDVGLGEVGYEGIDLLFPTPDFLKNHLQVVLKDLDDNTINFESILLNWNLPADCGLNREGRL